MPVAPHLLYLDVSDNQLVDLEGISAFGQLAGMNAAYNQISDLSHLDRPIGLNLGGNNISDLSPLLIYQTADHVSLQLWGNPFRRLGDLFLNWTNINISFEKRDVQTTEWLSCQEIEYVKSYIDSSVNIEWPIYSPCWEDPDRDYFYETEDAFPNDPAAAVDTDGDGMPDDWNDGMSQTGSTSDPILVLDTDDDDDGVLDTADAFPLISLGALTDTDGDGRPNDCDSDCQTRGMTADTDDDNDGLLDTREISLGINPLSIDSDKDGLDDQFEVDSGSRSPSSADYDIAAGANHTCVSSDTGVSCWPRGSGRATPPPDLGTVAQLELGNFFSCALTKPEGRVRCWNDDGEFNGPPGSNYEEISAGGYHLCALKGGVVTCSGSDSAGQGSVPELGPVRKVAAGGDHTCALTALLKVNCWGSDLGGVLDVPTLSNPVNLFSYNDVNCVKDDSGLVCWGDDSDGLLSSPSSLQPDVVELGRDHACLIENEEIVCWGNDYRGNTQPPSLSKPVQLAIGDFHSCALSAEGVACWGESGGGRTAVPDDVRFGDFDSDGERDDVDLDDDNDNVLDSDDAFPLDATESVDIDADGIGDNIDLDTSGDGIYDDRHFDPLDLQNLFLSRERITSTTDDYLAIGQGVQHNEVLYRLPVADAGIFLPNGLFSVAIEMFEQRNFGSSDKDFLTGISDGTNVILFTNNDSSNGGAWIGQDSGQTITEANRVSFWGNFEHYLVLFEFSDGQARLTVEVMSGEDAGYIESKIVGSVGQIDLSSKLELVLVGNSADEDYRLEGVSIIYPDRDFDGFPNVNDAFPLDAAESIDTDLDGTGNNADTDDDGDSVLDALDAFPLDVTEALDTDSDGTGNNADTDDDDDGFSDENDAFPNDPAASVDTDGDGQPDDWNEGKSAIDSTSSPQLVLDNDDDNDGVADSEDSDPLISSLQVEGTLLDPFADADNDGVNNVRTISQKTQWSGLTWILMA